MASSQPLVFKWGVIATGDISTKVITDMLVDPKTRDVHDVVHKIVAVGSRSAEKAQQFIDTVVKDKGAKAYGSYEQVYQDPVRSPYDYRVVSGIDRVCRMWMLCTLARLTPSTTRTPAMP
jgi:hypothetical protein